MTAVAKPTVYIVDDNNDVRDALPEVLSLEFSSGTPARNDMKLINHVRWEVVDKK